MIDIVRQQVRQIAPYNAGLTIAELRERYDAPVIAKLGSNENPFGPSVLVGAALNAAFEQVHLYPDPAGRRLRARLAEMLGQSEDCVILGNGSEDLISVVCRTVLRPSDRVVTPYPSFPLHEDYAQLMGAKVDRVPVRNDFTIDVPGLLAAARGARLLFLSNPMNPVGSWLDGEALTDLARQLPNDCLLVVDEAYFEYGRAIADCADGLAILRRMTRPWLVLRTFSKAYGLAGLRVGYGVTSDGDLRSMMDRVRTPFNVNCMAQEAALAALGDHEHLRSTVALAVAERQRIATSLATRGYRVAPSLGNFLFVDCGTLSAGFAEHLLRHGVIVKPWKQHGYEHFMRVSVGSPEENAQFLAALAD